MMMEEEDVIVSSLASLDLDGSRGQQQQEKTHGDSSGGFRFFDLPSELRIAILEFVLVLPAGTTVDLDPSNVRRIAPLLRVFLVSRRMHEEAYRVFYGANTFRLFPVHGRFFHTKRPLLARLPSHYRAALSLLELRLGPGWTAPPKCWKVTPALGLHNMQALRSLRVFIEIDPASHEIFRGFRVDNDFYTNFCREVLKGIFAQVASLEEVQFDAYTSVSLDSPLMCCLLEETKAMLKKISWGSERGWGDASLQILEAALAPAEPSSSANPAPAPEPSRSSSPSSSLLLLPHSSSSVTAAAAS